MDRIYASGAAGSAPSVPASPSSGYPTAGNPGTGTPATKPGPYWYHMIMEELMAIITAGGITPAPGTLNQVKQALDALYGSMIQPISASVAANALTLTLNPTGLNFRASSLASGTVSYRTVASAISLTIPAGVTLGTINGQPARLVVIALDNAGTVELAVVNLAGGSPLLDETNLMTTVAISGASNSATTVYSASARTNVPYRVVGFIDITEATAGTWATAPTVIQGNGGQALAALSSLGYGQTTQNVTASRAMGTTYYNTTGKPIYVSVNVSGTVANSTVYLSITVNGVLQDQCGYIAGTPAANFGVAAHAIVPPGASYVVGSTQASLASWTELR